MEGSDAKAIERPKSRLVLAEELHRLSLDSKRKPSFVFDLGREVADKEENWALNRRRDLTNWLQRHQPSKVRAADTLAVFAAKRADQDTRNYKDRVANYTRAYEAWTKLLTEGAPVTYMSLRKLAADVSVCGGKWMIMAPIRQVDNLWLRITWAMELGNLPEGCVMTKVSTASTADKGSHVLELWNRDFLDEACILETEKSARKLGIRLPMKYKPDIFTAVGIYRNNQWGLRPVIYTSEFQEAGNAFEVESSVDLAWKIELPRDPEKI